jgi:hypothetical protein
MFELNGLYKSKQFTLKIDDRKFSLFNPMKKEVCCGFITYISSYIKDNKKTKLAITNRQLICSSTNLNIGLIESIYYHNNTVIITYLDKTNNIKTNTLEKVH